MSAENYYNDLSEKYDELTKNHWSAPTNVFQQSHFFDGKKKGLIIGIGTGQDVSSFLNANISDITGIDISQKMIEICEEKFSKIKLYCSDFNNNHFYSSDKYDAIICSGVSEFIEDIESLISKISSLSEKNGVLIFSFEPIIHDHPHQKHASSSSKSLSGNGSQSIELITYRRQPELIQDLFKKYNFSLLHQTSFSSYKKSDIDVVYNQYILSKN